jgi:hypothetical protein
LFDLVGSHVQASMAIYPLSSERGIFAFKYKTTQHLTAKGDEL